MRRPFITAALSIYCAANLAVADVKVPKIFSDHMVLQRDIKVPVWGTADTGEKVTVTIGDQKSEATADADGKWKLTIDSLKASDQPIDMTVEGKNKLTIHDVLIGDVWVASGQSNMEFALVQAHNGKEEIAKADHPTIRLFFAAKVIAFEPQSDVGAGSRWVVCKPGEVDRFSAAGYFFAREIQEDQKVPVGMIGTCWGGTPAEAWTSLEALDATPLTKGLAKLFTDRKNGLSAAKEAYLNAVKEFEVAHKKWAEDGGAAFQDAVKKYPDELNKAKAANQPMPPKPTYAVVEPKKPTAPDADPHVPTVLTNGMIAPITPYAIKGAIWYQGESNAGNAMQYRALFPAMITDWRTRWGQGDFPFIWVQLANFDTSWKPGQAPVQSASGWPGLREAQDMTLKLPNTGQAVIIDIGESGDIHPKDKLDVGHRLALAAKHVAYGEDIVYTGPRYDSMKVDGDKIRVTFKNAAGGLTMAPKPTTRPGVAPTPVTEVTGFLIAGADHKFFWANATIEGDSVAVSSPDVKEPVAVRYGWAAYLECDLYNNEMLPAAPFRSDDWGDAPTSPKPAK